MYDELVKELRHYFYDVPLVLDAADAIEQLSNAGSAYGRGWTLGYDAGREESNPHWIPVTERLPEKTERCLVTRFDYVTNTPFLDLLWYEKGVWWNRHFTGDYAVTHWMPLPEPPKEETE